MRKEFLDVPSIGKLYIHHELVTYDYPLIFVCEDDYDSLYLFSEIRDLEDFEEWIAKKITREQYFDIIEDRLTFKDAYIRKENGPLYAFIKHYYVDDHVDCSYEKDVSEEILPSGDVCYGMINGETQLFYSDTDTDSRIVEIETFPNQSIDGIDVETHNSICTSYVGMLKGKYADDVSTMLLHSKAASYTIRLKVTSRNKSSVIAADAINEISKMVSSGSMYDYSNCVDQLKTMNYSQKFLETISKMNQDTLLIYNDRKADKKQTTRLNPSISAEKACQIKNEIQLEKEKRHTAEVSEDRYVGALIGYNLKGKSFVFKYEEQVEDKKCGKIVTVKRDIAGKLNEDFNDNQFVGLDCFYEALIRHYSDGTYELINLEKGNTFLFN